MGIGYIGAFGKSASDQTYVGGQFAYDGNNIFKFFIDAETGSSSSGQVYISAGTTTRNEYQRPLSIHGSTIALYGEDTTSVEKTTDHKITIDNDIIYLGHPENYIQIPSKAGRSNGFKIATGAVATIDFNGNSTTINNENTLTLNSERLVETIDAGSDSSAAITQTIRGTITTTGFRSLTMRSNDTYGMSLRIQPSQAYLGGSNSSLTINQTTACTLTSNNGINLIDKNGGIYLNSTGPEINLSANGVLLSLVSGTSGDFYLRSTHGQVFTDRNGVQITPKLAVGSGGMQVIGDIECDGTIRATENIGATAIFAQAVTIGNFQINQGWLDEIQKFYNKVNGGFDTLKNAYNSHTHNFSVTGTSAAQSYSGTTVVPAGTAVASITAANGLSYTAYAGRSSSATVPAGALGIAGFGRISVPYSGTLAGQTVTLSGTSGGPNIKA